MKEHQLSAQHRSLAWELLLFVVVVVVAVAAPLVDGDVLLVGGSDWSAETLEPPNLLRRLASLLSYVTDGWGDCVLPAPGLACTRGTS